MVGSFLGVGTFFLFCYLVRLKRGLSFKACFVPLFTTPLFLSLIFASAWRVFSLHPYSLLHSCGGPAGFIVGVGISRRLCSHSGSDALHEQTGKLIHSIVYTIFSLFFLAR